MIWGKTNHQIEIERAKRSRDYHWFAWYPVRLFGESRWVWLETVHVVHRDWPWGWTYERLTP
jgi:hypothetical protein